MKKFENLLMEATKISRNTKLNESFEMKEYEGKDLQKFNNIISALDDTDFADKGYAYVLSPGLLLIIIDRPRDRDDAFDDKIDVMNQIIQACAKNKVDVTNIFFDVDYDNYTDYYQYYF